MNPVPFTAAPPPPWPQMVPPYPSPSSGFWGNRNVHERLRELQDTLALAKAMQKELEVLVTMRDNAGPAEDEKMASIDVGFSKYLEDKKIDLGMQAFHSVNAANSLMSKLRAQLEPFRFVVDERTPWEEKSAAVRLSEKLLKSKRNKLWRKRKGKRIAEMRAKEREEFDKADRAADEWRAREIAKDVAQVKVQKMKEIAKLKAKEDKRRLESELELVLMVEKLQELWSIRIQKLKKQGHFLPEEDDKFLERVRAAVEEEERQAMAAADTAAAKDAIAIAEESRKTKESDGLVLKDSCGDESGTKESKDKRNGHKESTVHHTAPGSSEEKVSEGRSHGGTYDSVANLPIEFYHYYHGSNNDMGTLIEVISAAST
uniref:U11/U12 small nuclear ribonucleoprotein 59 kDa protein isoform X1 n=1 Tax=Rhizophora mucronata TaxID=61149 RepID=A0A2P2KFD1_RHIMU